jgi:ribonuclease HI
VHRYETVEHALLFCQYASEVWHGVKSEHDIHLQKNSSISPRTWVLELFPRGSEIQITTAAVTMWHIWDARNRLATKVNAYIDMMLAYLYTPRTDHSVKPKWAPSTEGTILVNVDSAIFASPRQMGAGILARDHSGSFKAACCVRSQDVMVPELVEALAIRRALTFAHEEGFPKIIVASDCLSAVQQIKSPVTDRSMLGSVIEDIKISSLLFSSCEFCHVPRVLNVAAHQLARRCASSVCSVWRGVPPDFIVMHSVKTL